MLDRGVQLSFRYYISVILLGYVYASTTIDSYNVNVVAPVDPYYGTDVNVVGPYWRDSEGRAEPTLNPNADFEKLRATIPCSNSPVQPCSSGEPYRRVDGSCNNFAKPLAGTSGDVLQRLLVPEYDAGLFKVSSKNGGLLPNPRVVNNAMKRMRIRNPPNDVNLLWLFFGQFVDHDLSLTATVVDPANPLNAVECRDCDRWQQTPACAPILVPTSDPSMASLFPDGRQRCLPFTRSSSIRSQYPSGPALEQLNINTAYLDLSVVYGSEVCTEKKVRLYVGGRLVEVNNPYSRHGLPPFETKDNFKDCRSLFGKCYRTGDSRSNEQLGLLTFHALFLREHNRLATKLQEINKHWDDERVFQETRRINIAQYQRIVYQEFLPIMIGNHKLVESGLALVQEPNVYYEGYDPASSSQILNEFASAVYRVGHTMVPNHIVTSDVFLRPTGSISLLHIFRNATRFFEISMIEDVVRGLITNRVKAIDPIIEDSLSENLFVKQGDKFTAEDLVALNVARGRDHGLPGYTSYRSLCGLGAVQSWNDLGLNEHDIRILQEMYSSVHDIDLYVGGLLEEPLSGAVVGPTFGCIIEKQFQLTRNGDRFWFENADTGLSPHQLIALRESSPVLRILAFNIEGPSYLPGNPFNLPDRNRNPLLSSTAVNDLDLGLWTDITEPVTNKKCYFKDIEVFAGHPLDISPCLTCICDGTHGKISCQGDYRPCLNQQAHNDEPCKLICGTYEERPNTGVYQRSARSAKTTPIDQSILVDPKEDYTSINSEENLNLGASYVNNPIQEIFPINGQPYSVGTKNPENPNLTEIEYYNDTSKNMPEDGTIMGSTYQYSHLNEPYTEEIMKHPALENTQGAYRPAVEINEVIQQLDLGLVTVNDHILDKQEQIHYETQDNSPKNPQNIVLENHQGFPLDTTGNSPNIAENTPQHSDKTEHPQDATTAEISQNQIENKYETSQPEIQYNVPESTFIIDYQSSEGINENYNPSTDAVKGELHHSETKNNYENNVENVDQYTDSAGEDIKEHPTLLNSNKPGDDGIDGIKYDGRLEENDHHLHHEGSGGSQEEVYKVKSEKIYRGTVYHPVYKKLRV